MTKCLVFWRKVAEFKEKDDFEGFRKWCGYKSYQQARRDWNAVDTFAIIAQKLGKELCEIISSETLTEDALAPIIHQRQDLPSGQFGKRETVPNAVQEKAIENLLPKIRDGIPITQRDAQRALAEAKGEPVAEEKEVEKKLCDLEQILRDLLMAVHPLKSPTLNCDDSCDIAGPCQAVKEKMKALGNTLVTKSRALQEYA